MIIVNLPLRIFFIIDQAIFRIAKLTRKIGNEIDKEIIMETLTFFYISFNDAGTAIKQVCHFGFNCLIIWDKVSPENDNNNNLHIYRVQKIVHNEFIFSVSFSHPSFNKIPGNRMAEPFFGNAECNPGRKRDRRRASAPYNLKQRRIKNLPCFKQAGYYFPAAKSL
jgi:hypothetical protein